MAGELTAEFKIFSIAIVDEGYFKIYKPWTFHDLDSYDRDKESQLDFN